MGEDIEKNIDGIYFKIGDEYKSLSSVNGVELGVDLVKGDDYYSEGFIDIEATKNEFSGTITILKQDMKKLKKILGINTITRKRARKLLMSVGIDKRKADMLAKGLPILYKMPRMEYMIRQAMENIIKAKRSGLWD